MSKYLVMVPIAGHLSVEVEADSQEEAIEKAMESGTIENLEGYEVLTRFHQGNVCYCPHPWEVEAELIEGEDD